MRRLLFAWFVAGSLAFAQTYTEGQLIEYQDYGKWEPGVFLYYTPSGQPVIRRKPSEYYPQGDTSAWDLPRLRPRAAAPPASQAAQPQPQPPVQQPPARPPQAQPQNRPPGPAGAPLSKAEVLGYLQTHLGNNPYGGNRQQVQQELAALIKTRGLNFTFQPNDEFSQQLDKVYAPDSTVRSPLWANAGPPPRQDEYMGQWKLQVNVVEHHSQDDRYRYTYDGGSNSGSLSINADGSYNWNGQRGTWRPAREDEKRDEGGAAIVLQRAKGGEDWIVYRNRQVAGNWIKVVNQNAPAGLQEHGYR